jgi:hypothetical protein
VRNAESVDPFDVDSIAAGLKSATIDEVPGRSWSLVDGSGQASRWVEMADDRRDPGSTTL